LHPIPNLEDQVPVFMSPSDRVAQLYPQAPGSLFVAFCDSQGYGGSILTRLHTRSKAWNVFALSNTWIVGSNPTRGKDVCPLLFCVGVLCK
jgi:hypothetical protein